MQNLKQRKREAINPSALICTMLTAMYYAGDTDSNLFDFLKLFILYWSVAS